MNIRPFIAALCASCCSPPVPRPPPRPSGSLHQRTARSPVRPLEVVCDDPDAPPELTAEAEDKALPMLMRPEYWDGSVTCGPDLVTMLIETRAGEVPAAEPGHGDHRYLPGGSLAGHRDGIG